VVLLIDDDDVADPLVGTRLGGRRRREGGEGHGGKSQPSRGESQPSRGEKSHGMRFTRVGRALNAVQPSARP
jgi:hypothetical protein